MAVDYKKLVEDETVASSGTTFQRIYVGDSSNLYVQAVTSGGTGTFTFYSSGERNPDGTSAAVTANTWTEETGVSLTGPVAAAANDSVHITGFHAPWVLVKFTASSGACTITRLNYCVKTS